MLTIMKHSTEAVTPSTKIRTSSLAAFAGFRVVIFDVVVSGEGRRSFSAATGDFFPDGPSSVCEAFRFLDGSALPADSASLLTLIRCRVTDKSCDFVVLLLWSLGFDPIGNFNFVNKNQIFINIS